MAYVDQRGDWRSWPCGVQRWLLNFNPLHCSANVYQAQKIIILLLLLLLTIEERKKGTVFEERES